MKDKGLLEKYNTIWDIVSFHIKKEFYSKPVYNKKIYGDETADFHNKKMSNEGSDYISLAIINVDSTLKKRRHRSFFFRPGDCDEEYIKSKCFDAFLRGQFQNVFFERKIFFLR